MFPLLFALAVAQSDPRPPPPPPPPPREEAARVSKEDEELVKDLALLEQIELVRNLELFEDEAEPPQPPGKAQ